MKVFYTNMDPVKALQCKALQVCLSFSLIFFYIINSLLQSYVTENCNNKNKNQTTKTV